MGLPNCCHVDAVGEWWATFFNKGRTIQPAFDIPPKIAVILLAIIGSTPIFYVSKWKTDLLGLRFSDLDLGLRHRSVQSDSMIYVIYSFIPFKILRDGV